MKSPTIKLSLDSERLAYATSCNFEVNVGLREITQVPIDDDNDNWSHYALADIASSISSDSFYATQQTIGIVDMVGSSFETEISLGDTTSLTYESTLIEAGVVGNINELAKLSLKFINNIEQ